MFCGLGRQNKGGVHKLVTNVSGIIKTYGVFNFEDRHHTHKSSRLEEHKDTVDISGAAMDYQHVRAALNNLPDIREDLVSAAALKYRSGVSMVPASDIADKMLSKL